MTENNLPGQAGTEELYLTRAQVEEIVDEKLGSLRVYISESDITRAQESVRSIAAQAEF
ncbi:MAG: hypothetical protein LIO77_08825 [Rikenellaceae bacterium]|nr:hypothetical protein [Rikenellaceae bacterium]